MCYVAWKVELISCSALLVVNMYRKYEKSMEIYACMVAEYSGGVG